MGRGPLLKPLERWVGHIDMRGDTSAGRSRSLPSLSYQPDPGRAQDEERLVQDEERLFTVLAPTGMPPPIQRRAMTPRPESLEGTTIYLVDETFNDGDIFLLEMLKWFAANMPEVKTEFRVKGGGSYTADDPALWQEIQAEGGLMVLAIGH